MYKSFLKSRTLWFAVAKAVSGILTAIIAVDPTIEKTGFVMTLIGIIDFFLRLDTKKELV